MKRIMLIVLPVFLMLTFGCNTTDYNSADDIPENNDNYNSSNLNDSSIEKKSYRIKRKIVHDGIFSEKDGTVDLITEYEYDDKGNIIKESTSDYEKIRMNEYLEYLYDYSGNRVLCNSYSNDLLSYYVIFEYNQDNQIVSEIRYYPKEDSEKAQTDDDFEESTRIDYKYDSEGMLIKKEVSNGKEIYTIDLEYNKDGNLIKEKANLITTTYTYDENNRITSKKSSNGVNEFYYYITNDSEKLEKKELVIGKNKTISSYKYDSNGNMIEEHIENDKENINQRIEYEYDEF